MEVRRLNPEHSGTLALKDFLIRKQEPERELTQAERDAQIEREQQAWKAQVFGRRRLAKAGRLNEKK